MRTSQAAELLSRLATLNQPLVSLTPEEWAGTGLEPRRKLVDAETRRPIFIYVDRLELMEVIRVSHNLHPKGTNICRTLNWKEKAEGTQ